jgi:hypothetical protein
VPRYSDPASGFAVDYPHDWEVAAATAGVDPTPVPQEGERAGSPTSRPVQVSTYEGSAAPVATRPSASLPAHPPDWHVADGTLSDVTGDRVPEWVLLVWRPWRDWPIQRWSAATSPIAGFHDAAGESCHLILLDPRDGHEIWGGSALPVPFLALAVEDVDGDGGNEVVTVEGSYARGRDSPGTRVGVWRWNGFGFTLLWHSPPGTMDPHCLDDTDRCGMLDLMADLSSLRRSE